MVPRLSWLSFTTLFATVLSGSLEPRASDPLASCPGYKATNVKSTAFSLTADLTLAGKACDAYGSDLKSLTLTVEYQTGTLLSLFVES